MASFNEIIQGEKPVLVDFFAEWCGPCKSMAPVLQSLVKELDGKAIVLKVDIDKNQATARAFNVQGVPTFIVFKSGKQLWRQSGALPQHILREAIEKQI